MRFTRWRAGAVVHLCIRLRGCASASLPPPATPAWALSATAILPLPPAKLPAWDGKLQWLESRLANVPPEKPSEALIHQLAKATTLDPASGRPMPGSLGFIQATSPRPTCYSGQACPQTGYWEVAHHSARYYSVVGGETIRRFERGEIMPTPVMQTRNERLLLPDKITVREERVKWRLFGEA